jgi:hypothetical protein
VGQNDPITRNERRCRFVATGFKAKDDCHWPSL